MTDVKRRLEQLSPGRRRLVERLSAQSSSHPDPPGAVAGAPGVYNVLSHDLVDRFRTADRETDAGAARKAAVRGFYEAVNGQLDAGVARDHALFLNYGYVADGNNERTAVELPRYMLNRNSVQLVLEVVGDCEIDGRSVLDVGCGRGGTISVLDEFYKPRTLVGVDISPTAIEFCRRRHVSPRIRFVLGDAEALPFDGCCFDCVTNIESSHSYPDVGAFYAEVARVLAPGGALLYSDTIPRQAIGDRIQRLASLGLALELARDITPNVLRSCDEDARLRAQAFSEGNEPEMLDDFLATPESRTYELMRSGQMVYGIWRFRKG